jgi:hypothetical protein
MPLRQRVSQPLLPLQWTEAAIFAAVALALAGYCFWRLSRRLM